jgi:hypothetical protein
MNHQRQEVISHWLTVAFMTVFGLGLIGWYLHGMRSGLASSSWPSVPATMIRVGVSDSQDDDNGWSYAPEVEYSYTVDGQTFTATRIGFVSDGDYDSSSMGAANDIAQSWKNKSDLRAFYDPSEPSRACLAPGAELRLFTLAMVLLMGGGLAFIGLWMAKTGPGWGKAT